jgi:aminocarboxymuconate-semialdehyde decarboxylase
MQIDVHAHALSEACLDAMANHPDFRGGVEKDGPGAYAIPSYGPLDPGVHDLAMRIEVMDKIGTDVQMVSPPMVPGQPTSMTVDQARWINAHTASLAESSGGRLAGLAVMPLAEPDQIASEMRRAVDEQGFRALHLTTTADGTPLDLPQFAELWATMEELELFGVMHPMTGMLRPALDDYSMRILVDWPQETTIAVGRLIYSGVLERHPALRLCLCHGGGTLPYLRGRIDRGYFAPLYEANLECRANISQPPSAYLDRLYFDTCVASPESLAFLIEVMGANRVMLGTDYPFEIGDADMALARPAIDALESDAREQVLGANAAALLPDLSR